MIHFVSGVTVLGLLSAATAQHPEDLAGAPPPPATASAWHAFLDANGPDWTIERNPATGTPRAIFGPGMKLAGPVASLDAARVQARRVLDNQRQLLGTGKSEFVEVIGAKANRVYVFVYDQRFRGLDVISGRADVRIHDVGVVSLFGASAVPIPEDFSIAPGITPATAAVRAAREVLGRNPIAGALPPRLVIWANSTAPIKTRATLAFEVQIDSRPARTEVGKAYVNAVTGALLEFKNEVFECGCGRPHVVAPAPRSSPTEPYATRLERGVALARATAKHTSDPPSAPRGDGPPLTLTGRVMAWTNRGSSPTGALTNSPLQNALVVSLVGSAYTDSNGRFSITYTGSTRQTVGVNLVGRHCKLVRVDAGTRVRASVLMTAGTFQTIQLGSATMSQLDRAQTTAYWFTDDCNTWFRSLGMPTTQMNQLSNMDPLVNIASSCNAFYTNFTTNFYQESTTCNMTAYETVIQHEWGHGADHAFGGISQQDGLSEGWGDILATFRSRQPIVGPNFRKSGGFVRTALNTRTYPAGGGVHQQGQTWMGFAWDVRTNLISSQGTAGESRATSIVIKSIIADAVNQPDAVREVFLLDDDDGNLNNGTPNYQELEQAALKRRLPYPVRLSNQRDMIHFAFETGTGAQAQNLATQANSPVFGANPWARPTRLGTAALRGSDNLTVTDFNYVETDFRGPLYGDLTLHFWMRERIDPGIAGLSYLCGGLNSFRAFTGGAAQDGLSVRSWGGASLDLPRVGATLQTRARNPLGVCVSLTINSGLRQAQFYIDGSPHGAALPISGPVDIAAAANGFRIGKHTSNTSSSAYDLDEFRLINRVATPDEIQSWCQPQKSLYFKFDRGLGDVAVDYGTDSRTAETRGTAPGPWQKPGQFGAAMLRGSDNTDAFSVNTCTTGFRGPLHGSATFHWWMKQRVDPGNSLSYLWGGLGSLRCFTNGVANEGLWVRSGPGVDLKLTDDIQDLARGSRGVWIGITIDAATGKAQWFVNGLPHGSSVTIPHGMDLGVQPSALIVGKHVSDLSSSAYDIDEFRFENRAAAPSEILAWTGAPTAATGRLGKRCGLDLSNLGGRPILGNARYVHTIQATPAMATSCLFVIGVRASPSFDMGIAFGSLTGCPWFPAFDLQVPLVTDTRGYRGVPGAVPNSTSAVGAHLDVQVLGFQGSRPVQSNATSHVIELR